MGPEFEPRRDALGWVRGRRDVLFDLMRIYLGIGLFVKGIYFITRDREFLLKVLRDPAVEFKFDFINTFLAHYVPLAHIGGGALLAFGVMTRISAGFQLPILFGAVFFVYAGEGLFTHDQDFQFTALVFFLLILVFLHGGGRLSVDYQLRKRGTPPA